MLPSIVLRISPHKVPISKEDVIWEGSAYVADSEKEEILKKYRNNKFNVDKCEIITLDSGKRFVLALQRSRI